MSQVLFTAVGVTPQQWLAYSPDMKDTLLIAYLSGLHLAQTKVQRQQIIDSADRTARSIARIQPRPAGDPQDDFSFDSDDPDVVYANRPADSGQNNNHGQFLDPTLANLINSLATTAGKTTVDIVQAINQTDQRRILAESAEVIAAANAQYGRTTTLQEREAFLRQAAGQFQAGYPGYQRQGMSTGTMIAIGLGVLLVGGVLIMAVSKPSAPPMYYPPPRRNPRSCKR